MSTKNVICLKYGSKYSAEYVNKLYSMISRYSTGNIKFWCLTDHSIGLNDQISIIPLTVVDGIEGWWYKLFLFDPLFELKGTFLFLDLDVVIVNSIDKFFEHSLSNFCISRGFSKNNKTGMNSSCFRFEGGSYTSLYEKFMINRTNIMSRLHGDQDWLQEQITDHSFWPDEWLLSYKIDLNNKYVLGENTSIVVFHGLPKPDQLEIDNEFRKRWY